MQANEQEQPIKNSLKPVKVLVIEDNEEHWLLFQRLIHADLPQVNLVRLASASQTLALFEEWQSQEWELPRLILLDLYLPTSRHGWQVLEHLKQMPAPTSLIPIVILSASNSQVDIANAYQLGASAYLVKPIDFSHWPAYIQSICAYWWEISAFPPLQYVL